MSQLSLSVNELRTNAQQWEALTTEGHCIVLAPPGSGKTKLLTTRVAVDLANKIVHPQGAACVTMTNPAAGELRDRLTALDLGHRHSLFIGTVHSFVLTRIVLPFATFVGRPELHDMSIAGDAESKGALAEVMRAAGVPGGQSREAKSAREGMKSTVARHRKRLSTPDEWAQLGPLAVDVNRRYEELLHNRGLFDFDELISLGVDFVENHPQIRRVLNAQYPCIYVDEYQDLAPGLDRLVKSLCFDHPTGSELFAVGDPDQSVYAFTGSRPELLIELAGRSDVTSVLLRRNYRCGQEIVRVAQNVKHGDSPVDANREGGTVTATECPDGFLQQCARCVELIQAVQQRGIPLHEIAVLCPANDLCQTVTAELREAGVPAFFRNTEDYRHTTSTAFIEGCAAWACAGRETSNYRLGYPLRQWRSICGSARSRELDAVLTELLMSYEDLESEPASTFLEDLLATGLGNALKRPALGEDAAQVAAMRTALTTGALSELTIADLAGRSSKTDRVEVTTMTSSKGLEFDVVALLGIDQGRLPFFSSTEGTEGLAEDRRKFYVSLTRARDEVHIFYSGFVEWASGFVGRNGPSQLLTEIGVL
jgi:DNA helicase-2/ATP-dependent DNA helicase PcrA